MSELINVQPAVSISDLKVHFPIYTGLFPRAHGAVRAVDGVSFDIERGSVFALVGESGCGKTTVAQAILGLNRKTGGTIKLALGAKKNTGIELDTLSPAARRKFRRYMQLIFQDPYSSLNPRMTIRTILEEALIIHRLAKTAPQRSAIIAQLIRQVGLAPEYLGRYPHEFSGGQRQRIGIARALCCKPELLVADEPVSALDVSIRAQILNLLQDLRKEFNLTLMLISHDLAVVRHIADRVAVMYLGRIMEIGPARSVFSQPRHPYTHLLLQSIPQPGIKRIRLSPSIIDDATAATPSNGCLFYERCPKRSEACREQAPTLKPILADHQTACINV